MQDTAPDEPYISPTELKSEILELRAACKALIAKNEEYAGIILALRGASSASLRMRLQY